MTLGYCIVRFSQWDNRMHGQSFCKVQRGKAFRQGPGLLSAGWPKGGRLERNHRILFWGSARLLPLFQLFGSPWFEGIEATRYFVLEHFTYAGELYRWRPYVFCHLGSGEADRFVDDVCGLSGDTLSWSGMATHWPNGREDDDWDWETRGVVEPCAAQKGS